MARLPGDLLGLPAVCRRDLPTPRSMRSQTTRPCAPGIRESEQKARLFSAGGKAAASAGGILRAGPRGMISSEISGRSLALLYRYLVEIIYPVRDWPGKARRIPPVGQGKYGHPSAMVRRGEGVHGRRRGDLNPGLFPAGRDARPMGDRRWRRRPAFDRLAGHGPLPAHAGFGRLKPARPRMPAPPGGYPALFAASHRHPARLFMLLNPRRAWPIKRGIRAASRC